MKNFFKLLALNLAIIVTFRLLLGLFLYLFHLPVDPQFPYYQSDLVRVYPQFQTAFAHFDGIHYLRIASYGYRDVGTQAFFPLYPILVHLITFITHNALVAGQVISVISLAFALTGLYYLFPNLKLYAISLLLIFPTSFFLVSVYTESLFLALTLWFFVMLKKESYLTAAFIAALASANRFAGILLLLPLLYELIKSRQSLFKIILHLLIGSAGLLSYMAYLGSAFHDPLMFIHVLPLFGSNRSGGSVILLPVVIWRYLKIFFTVAPVTLLYARAVLEFGIFTFFSSLIIIFWRKLSPVFLLYLIPSLLLPTLSGTLSSFPRYALVLFPFFLPLLPLKKYYLLYALSLVLFIWCFTTVARGFFIS